MRPVNRMLPDDLIKEVEKRYDAKYVIDSCLKFDIVRNDVWANFPVVVFYTEQAHPRGSNYFALYKNGLGEVMITNGLNAVEGEFNGFLFDDGDLVHSRYRHDYFDHRGAVVDGGRDYFRSSGSPPDGARLVKFKVVDGELIEVNDVQT